jgi:hypothetical protein
MCLNVLMSLQTFQKCISMKRILVIFLVGFWAFKTFGQPSVDIGFFGGAGTYLGDMTKIELNKSLNPAYGGFLRFNFNPRYALRFNALNGVIGATGEFESTPHNFSKDVLDISLQFEWNYLKYIVGDKGTHWSTYLFGGVGMQTFGYQTKPIFTPTIPFGLGFKFNLSKRLGIGLEGGMRKSFSDKLDNLDDPLSYTNQQGIPIKYTDMYHNNDWTVYSGVHLVYKVIYGNRNWTVRTKKDNILDWGIWNKNRKE